MWYRIRGAQGLGSALSAARRETGLTQDQLAGRLGADRTTLIGMEAGRNPALGRLVRAFSLLGYDLVAVPRTAEIIVREQPVPADDR
jgi:transcriptional regulator with XRE-family HTH domain